MPFAVTVVHTPTLLIVEGAGPATLADLCGYMNLVAEVAVRTGIRRALLDLTAVTISLSFTEHLTFGAHTAAQLGAMERVASAVAPEYRTGTSEKAAQKMGLRFRTFTAVNDAFEWVAA